MYWASKTNTTARARPQFKQHMEPTVPRRPIRFYTVDRPSTLRKIETPLGRRREKSQRQKNDRRNRFQKNFSAGADAGADEGPSRHCGPRRPRHHSPPLGQGPASTAGAWASTPGFKQRHAGGAPQNTQPAARRRRRRHNARTGGAGARAPMCPRAQHGAWPSQAPQLSAAGPPP